MGRRCCEPCGWPRRVEASNAPWNGGGGSGLEAASPSRSAGVRLVPTRRDLTLPAGTRAGTLLMTAIFGVRLYLKHKDNDSFNITM